MNDEISYGSQHNHNPSYADADMIMKCRHYDGALQEGMWMMFQIWVISWGSNGNESKGFSRSFRRIRVWAVCRRWLKKNIL